MNLLPFVASGIGLGAVYAMSSVGLVILYRASGTLNFAFGAFGGLAAFLSWELQRDGVPQPLTWFIGIALAVAILMAGGVGLLLSRTRIGLGMRALAADRHISALIGIRVTTTDSIAWLISGAFAGIAGLLLANLIRLDPVFLTFLVIPAIASAILGRLSSLPGAFIGGMFAGMLEAVLTGVPELSSFRSAGPFVAALLFMTIVGAGEGVGARE